MIKKTTNSTTSKKRRHTSHKSKTGIYASKKGGPVSYRSTWELHYAEYLDEDKDVEKFYYEKIKIPYISNFKTRKLRNYIPDFVVYFTDGTVKVVEIKPANMTEKVLNEKKFDAARTWCEGNKSEFIVLTEVELKKMGVL